MIGPLITRELTISFRRGSVHLLVLAQTLLALALVAAGDGLVQQLTPLNPPALGATLPATQSGLPGVAASFLDAALFVGEVAWLLLFCLVAVPVIAGPAIARERERGTLPVLLGTGATPLAIVGAKSVAVLVQAGLVLLTALPTLGLVFVFGSVSPSLALGGAALLGAWVATIAGLGLLCSALLRSSGGAIAATFAGAVALLAGTLAAPLVATQLGARVPDLAYRLSLPAALLSLHPELGRRLTEQIRGLWPKVAVLDPSPLEPPWLPFVAACLLAALALALLASAVVSKSPGRA